LEDEYEKFACHSEWVGKQLLAEQNLSARPHRKQTLSRINLQWTAKKTDLIELLYALNAAGSFNSGNISDTVAPLYRTNSSR
jgi:hypothetical protein